MTRKEIEELVDDDIVELSKVIDYFIYEYLEGRTPNPCIACN